MFGGGASCGLLVVALSVLAVALLVAAVCMYKGGSSLCERADGAFCSEFFGIFSNYYSDLGRQCTYARPAACADGSGGGGDTDASNDDVQHAIVRVLFGASGAAMALAVGVAAWAHARAAAGRPARAAVVLACGAVFVVGTALAVAVPSDKDSLLHLSGVVAARIALSFITWLAVPGGARAVKGLALAALASDVLLIGISLLLRVTSRDPAHHALRVRVEAALQRAVSAIAAGQFAVLAYATLTL